MKRFINFLAIALLLVLTLTSCNLEFGKDSSEEVTQEGTKNIVIFELDQNNKVKIADSSPIPVDGIVTYPATVNSVAVQGLSPNGIGQNQRDLITSIILPSEYTNIETNSFTNLSNLVCVSVLCPTATIDALAFADCPELKKIMVVNDDVPISIDAILNIRADFVIQVGLDSYTLDEEPTATTYKTITGLD